MSVTINTSMVCILIRVRIEGHRDDVDLPNRVLLIKHRLDEAHLQMFIL